MKLKRKESNQRSTATLSREHDAENSPKALDEESWFVKHAIRETTSGAWTLAA